MSNSISKESAIANLKRFFGDNVSGRVSIDEIFVNAGRKDDTYERNMSWLYNKMSSMRKYGFFEKGHTVRNHVRALDSLVLTTEGRKALGIDNVVSPTPVKDRREEVHDSLREVTFDSVQEDVEILRKRFPALEVVYDVRLKKKEMPMVR